MGNGYTEESSTIIHLLVDKGGSWIQSFLTRYVLQVTIYCIWRERSERRHGEAPRGEEVG